MMELCLAFLAGLSLALAAALPDLKWTLDWMGTSPGSTTSGAGFYAAELVAWVFGLVALSWGPSRRRVPNSAFAIAALWCLAIGVGAWQGWRLGAVFRNIVAEGRSVLMVPALLGLLALNRRAWIVALCAGTWGLLVGVGLQTALLVLEPTGQTNYNIVPVPILMFEHNMPWFLLLALAELALLLRQSKESKALRLGGLLFLWLLLWLSFLRSLWLALAAGTLVAAIGLYLYGHAKQAWRLLTWQAMTAVLGLGLALLAQRATTPDGDFLLRFRLMRLGQVLHLYNPPSERTVLGPPNSALLQRLAIRGGLYAQISATDSKLTASKQRILDPSVDDRSIMVRLSWQAYRQYPWAGSGLGSVLEYNYPPNRRVMRDPHNGYAWILKCGLLGILAVGAILLVPLVKALRGVGRPQQELPIAAIAALVILAAGEFFHTGWLQVPTLLAWAVVVAALLRPREA